MTFLVNAVYFAVAILFILGLKAMSSPVTARKGIMWAGLGMILATVATFFYPGEGKTLFLFFGEGKTINLVLTVVAIAIGGGVAWLPGLCGGDFAEGAAFGGVDGGDEGIHVITGALEGGFGGLEIGGGGIALEGGQLHAALGFELLAEELLRAGVIELRGFCGDLGTGNALVRTIDGHGLFTTRMPP